MIIPTHRQTQRGSERGSAVIVLLVLLALVLIYVGANLRTLHFLGRDLKLVERQQIRRLESTAANTNRVPIPKPDQVKGSVL